MKKIFVIPKKSFIESGVQFLSEKDGGAQLLGFINAEKKTVEFPLGTISSGLSFSISIDKFDMDSSLSELLDAQNKKIASLESELKKAKKE